VSSDVSEEHIASIFRVEKEAEQETSMKAGGKLVSYSANFSALKMEAICFSKTSGDTQRTTRRYISEDGTLHNHRCENLKSYN
jgi:hypothetical protein